MTDAVHPSAAPPAAAVPPLPGHLVAESDRAITVRVTEGTWTFDRTDVLGVTEWRGGPAGSEPGRPVLVQIRPGATAEFTQRVRIDLIERPMTLPQAQPPAHGDDLLERLTENWARELRLPIGPGAGGATLTYCQTRSVARSDDGLACDSLD
jgi:hypothetical protein